jgi:hypothetical protein
MENTAYKGKEDYIVRASKKVGDKQIDCDARVRPRRRVRRLLRA